MAGRIANIEGLTAKERHACQLRSEGMTQVDAYSISHKVKQEKGRTAENAAYRLFLKPECQKYLDKLWGDKPMEHITASH